MLKLISQSYKKGWLGKIIERLERKENRFATLYLTDLDGGVQRHPYDFKSHMLAYCMDVWVYASIRAIAEAVSGIPLLAQRKIIVDSEDVWETITDHPLSQLIEKPNPEDPANYIIGEFVTDVYSSGNGFLHYAQTDNELYTLQPDWVKVKRDKQGKNPSYVVQKNVSSYNADFDEIIHLKLSSPNNKNYGFPPSEVIKNAIMTKLALSGYLKNYFENDAMPGTTISTDQTLSPPQREQLRQEIDQVHKGYRKAHTTAILDAGTKMDRLSHAIKELMPVELYRCIREEILAAYGVSHVMVGVLDDASFSNATVQERVFYQNRILPTLRMIEGILDLQLVPFFGDDLRLWFDRATIAPLQEDKEVQAKRLIVLVNGMNPILTQNEARKELGYKPIDGGDELNRPMVLPTFEPQEEVEVEDENESENESEDDTEKRIKIIRLNQRSLVKEERWQVHYNHVKTLEESFERKMMQFFDSQLGRVLSRLRDMRSENGHLSAIKLFTEVHRMKLDDGDTGLIFPIDVENDKIRKHVTGTYERELMVAGQQAMAEMGVTFGFNINTPEVFLMLEEAYNRIIKVNNATYALIKDVLREGYEEGWALDKISKEIRGTYKDFSKPRSMRIAQTEMNGIVNGGHLEGGVQAGGEKKEWMSAMLPDSRPWHVDAQNQGLIPIKQRFMVGDSMMMYPSDPNGLAMDVINCHCAVITH